jgi:hypothetical protein
MEEILEIVETPNLSCCCKCELRINWIVSTIAGSESASGFIVQKFSRCMEPRNILDVVDYQNITYFEAWKVEDGIITAEDKGVQCDDKFLIGGRIIEEFCRSVDKNGRFTFRGEVYWIPFGSDLFETIDKWERGCVKQAGDLRATYDDVEIGPEYRHFTRKPFVHEWNLTDETVIYSKAKEVLFEFFPNSTQRDYEMLVANVYYMLTEKHRDIADRIVMEWKMEKQFNMDGTAI